MIYYGPEPRQLNTAATLPLDEWTGVLVGLMEHIERQREPLTTCAACGALVRPSEHCPGCSMDAHLDDLMAAACDRERRRSGVAWLMSVRNRGERGAIRAVDVWACLLSLPAIYFLHVFFTRY